METKVCCRCKIEKSVADFYKDKTSKSGYKSHCKSCEKIYLKDLSAREKHTPEFKLCSRCKQIKHKSEFSKYAYTTDGLSHKCKSCTKDVFEEIKVKPKRSVESKTCSICKETKPIDDFYKSNMISDGRMSCCKFCANKRNKDRIDNILNVRLANNIRSRVRLALKGNLKPAKTMAALGCSMDFFRDYIESQFEPWMTWDNWGIDTWHLDHKVPLANFDLSDKAQFLKACHYSNYQPLSAKDNLKKNRFVV